MIWIADFPRRANQAPRFCKDAPLLSWCMAKDIALAGRPGKLDRHKVRARLIGIVATEIDRLAHLAHRIVERLAAFGLQQRDQAAAPRLQKIARAFEHGGTRGDGRLRPAGEA